jgi:hypothetical protein
MEEGQFPHLTVILWTNPASVAAVHGNGLTIDYWAQVPSTQQWLHTTRDVVVSAAANDNTPTEAANDNDPTTTTAATGAE